MRIIHTADIHLDSNLKTNLDASKAKERKSELLENFVRMVEYANINNVSAVCISGDLFDVKKISATARNRVLDAIKAHPDIEFYYLKGNHDFDNFLSGMEEGLENLFLFTDQWSFYSPRGSERIVIGGAELSYDNQNALYDSLFLEPSKFNIVMLHGQQAKAASDKTETVNLKALRNKNIDYLALGHIHSHQEEMIDGRCLKVYPGCLDPRGFDECGEHGFMLLDIDEKSGRYSHEFVPFATRNIYTIEVDVSNCESTGDIITKVDKCVSDGEATDRDIVKIILTGSCDIESEKDVNLVLKHFEPCFWFLKVSDDTTVKVRYEDYALDKSLKGAFVRRVMALTDKSEEEKARIIQYGLSAITGGEVEECD